MDIDRQLDPLRAIPPYLISEPEEEETNVILTTTDEDGNDQVLHLLQGSVSEVYHAFKRDHMKKEVRF